MSSNTLGKFRLEYFPVVFFSTLMGTTGLTIAWQKAALFLGAPGWIGNLLLLVTLAWFTAVLSCYSVKLFRHPEAVLEEFNHPIKISFFAGFSTGFILLSVALFEIVPALSHLLWWIGAASQLAIIVTAMNIWIHQDRSELGHTTPAWFIPAVGNILVPIGGVHHGYLEISWFFFSIGLVYWLVLKSLFFSRVIGHSPLPEKLQPTLFILIAPPAAGCLAYLQLNGLTLDGFSRLLYYSAMFLLLLMACQWRRFWHLPFYMSWWAYSFPLAAFTVATMTMATLQQSDFLQALSYVMLALTSAIIVTIATNTLKAVYRAQVFHPDV